MKYAFPVKSADLNPPIEAETPDWAFDEAIKRLNEELVRKGYNPSYGPSDRKLSAVTVLARHIAKHESKPEWKPTKEQLELARKAAAAEGTRRNFPRKEMEEVIAGESDSWGLVQAAINVFRLLDEAKA